MKRLSEVDELEELFSNINLHVELSQNEVVESSNHDSNVTETGDGSDTSTDNEESTCDLDGLRSLRPKPDKNKKSLENEESDKLVEADNVRTRGRPRNNRPNLHSSRPYESSSNQRVLLNQNLYAGGGVVTTEQSQIPNHHEQAPLIPDFSQLFDVKLNETKNTVKDFDVLLSLDDGFSDGPSNDNQFLQPGIKDSIPLDIKLQDLVTIENHNAPNDFGDTIPFDSIISDETMCKFINFSEPLQDLEISDNFLEMLDPSNDQLLFDTITQIAEEQFSPHSTDTGYTSDNGSYSNSPSSSLTSSVEVPLRQVTPSPISSASSTPPLAKFTHKKKKSNYLSGLDKTYRQTCCEAILKKGREGGLNQKDNKNRTLLHLAIEQKNETYAIVMLNMLQTSFENGTGGKTLPSFSDLPSFLNQEDDYGRTPLLLACIYNMPMILEYLLDCKASPLLKDKFAFGSVLHYVCERGSRFLSIAEILCNKASSCLNMENVRKETPLHIAVGYHGIKHEDGSSGTVEVVNNHSMIELVLSKCAMLGLQDEKGRTPLHWMMLTKSFDLLDLSYTTACDWKHAVNLRNADGRTILHSAAQLRDLELEKQKKLVEKLVDYGTSPLIRDNSGKYPRDLIPGDRKDYFTVLNGYFCERAGWQHTDIGLC